ncbi:Na(+)/H(+) antiporter subunit B [Helicovermis profundi]|uniref:Na(+)/H(+) antiporter subunit B n=1 Tax=Helicovermis profundi TaxID=3065157 RepID=A0AAU9EMV2_9FIRM|nr:Na(+)/H(+) antiporter subunit B [Clostridia bacterium S502]
MKKIVAILFLGILGFFIFSGIYANDAFGSFGKVNLNDRVSNKFITKSVTNDNEIVEYNKSSNLETGSSNYVTSIVVNYRSFDTLGEVTVLFVSSLGVALLLGSFGGKLTLKYKANFILRVGAKTVFPLIALIGIYIFTHGHLTPGGGFPGGSMIASAVLLLYLSDENFRAKMSSFKLTESLMGSLYVLVGIFGLFTAGYFLSNFLNTGVVGNLFSAGIVPIVYVLVGLKVGSELTGIITDFLKEEVNE